VLKGLVVIIVMVAFDGDEVMRREKYKLISIENCLSFNSTYPGTKKKWNREFTTQNEQSRKFFVLFVVQKASSTMVRK
jgi:hypothetical protein